MNKLDNLQTEQTEIDRPYFAPLLAWQHKAWTQFTTQYQQKTLPHGLLASGMAGIGKRAFVWRAVAWLLCQDKSEQGACGACESCLWLKADTHPNVQHLPKDGATGIKIDDIRALQDFFYTKSQDARLVVLDNADTMTLGASNALLKTLEEPPVGVFLFLISDNPTALLPTIKSRVQVLPLLPIDEQFAYQYLKENLNNLDDKSAKTLLHLADFAPLTAVNLANQAWFDKRILWIKTYVALQNRTRSPILASEYWQGVLPLSEFLLLSRLMIAELWRLSLDLPSLHADIDTPSLIANLQIPLDNDRLDILMACCDDIAKSLVQNVNEKNAYDRLILAMSE